MVRKPIPHDFKPNSAGTTRNIQRKGILLSTLQSRREPEKLVNSLSAKSNYDLAKGWGDLLLDSWLFAWAEGNGRGTRMRMWMQRGVSNASSHSDEFAWNCEKKTARKKNNMRKYDLRHKYDFCCECEIVNQLKSFTNSVAKLTHKHIRRDFQFKVFSSFFFFFCLLLWLLCLLLLCCCCGFV